MPGSTAPAPVPARLAVRWGLIAALCIPPAFYAVLFFGSASGPKMGQDSAVLLMLLAVIVMPVMALVTFITAIVLSFRRREYLVAVVAHLIAAGALGIAILRS